jgi:flavodoxin
MRKTLVTYYSKTGNTKKIAEAIYAVLTGIKEFKPISEVEDINNYQLIFIGFPVQAHSVPYPVEKLLNSIPAGKKIALFSTHGSLTGGQLSREAIEHAITLAAKAKVLGTFSCRGKVSLEALEALKKSPEHEAWAEMAASASTHPNEADLEDARAFAKWISTLHDHHHHL